MNNFLSLIKSNPITLVSVLVVISCVGFFIYLTMQGAAFTERLSERGSAIRTIQNLYRTQVTIPPEDADGVPRRLRIVVNEEAISQLNQAFGRMNKEYRGIFKAAVQLNQHNHLPLLDNLFPRMGDAAMPYTAQEEYIKAIRAMLSESTANALLPRLDAGVAPGEADMNAALERVTDDFLRSGVGPTSRTLTVQDLTPAQREQLEKLRRQAVLDVLADRAESIHLYVDEMYDIRSEDFPFDVGGWATQQRQPQIWQVWEGQRSLWVQQDIAQAIALTNRTSSPDWNVTSVPVKKLEEVFVAPGYVGIHHDGLLVGGQIPRDATTELLTAPENLNLGSPDEPLPNNFAIAPTGRRSNAIYDVVHSRLVVHADYQQLPDLFNNLARVNFMTVLRCEITQVDEYDMLRRGYVYGSGDIVQAELIIESIWLRQWLEPLMPRQVKPYMGIKTADN